jgi:acyl carrier protein
MANVREELKQVIAEIGEIDEVDRISDDADLYADLGLDSMQALEIVLEMEKRFSVQIPEEALKDIRSLGDAVKVAEKYGAKKS